jgi:hypothetical protein
MPSNTRKHKPHETMSSPGIDRANAFAGVAANWIRVFELAGQMFKTIFGRDGGPRVEYRTDPETQRQLQAAQAQLGELQAQLVASMAEAKKRSDPAFFKQAQKDVFKALIGKLAAGLELTSAIPPMFALARNVLVIGDVSSGKSSLLNRLFAIQPPLKAGIGHTTLGVAAVHTVGNVVLWDSAGGNQDLMFYDLDTLNFIKGASAVVILYETSLVTVSPVVQVVAAIKQRDATQFVCVRTKCDLYDPATDENTIAEEVAVDRAHLSGDLGLPAARILTTAAKGGCDFENAALKAWIMGA